MDLIKKSLICALLAFVFAGCTTVTNLTATREHRTTTGLYRVETTWTSDKVGILPETVKVYAVVGTDLIPMTHTPVVHDRWETFLPVPADQNSVRYRFKYEYEYNAMGGRRKDSVLSQEFKLTVSDKR